MKRQRQIVLAVFFLLSIITLVWAYRRFLGFRLWCAFLLAFSQWGILQSRSHPSQSRQEVERRIFCASVHEYGSFSNLFLSGYFVWSPEKGEYQGQIGGKQVVYAPQAGDQYVSYKVLDIMPIDVVYDRQGKTRICHPSFKH
jgi:hypothetical protein